ncbi:cell surface glycoprotein CD200 receptor 1-A isoform X2 [Syngnathus scovelli]|uniref:cell surface glycoprotein CD200 receptor 1-A isoform X2 n=1 Tax=Syngnathus scovelli TaxID=161590 RepID=UPI00210F2918|nr:cell surface glycoprotein CD200 receptor 1-B isoform X2 [Syngnathus scovelli]
MKEPIGVSAVILLLSLLCQAWSQDSVTHLYFNVGSDVMLNCSNILKDLMSKEILYVIWRVDLVGNKECRVGWQKFTGLLDTCTDGKSLHSISESCSDLHSISESCSYLHIPNFSERDVGIYMYEMAFIGGTHTCKVSASITVPPSISSWLELRDNNSMVAVCAAEGGKPAANVTWRHAENESAVVTQWHSGGLFSVESRLKLPEGPKNATCIIRHPYWEAEKTLVPSHRKRLLEIVVCLLIVVSILMVPAALLFFMYKKQIMLRNCLITDRSATKPEPITHKAEIEETEEVEPYASYFQRVNSIYNL